MNISNQQRPCTWTPGRWALPDGGEADGKPLTQPLDVFTLCTQMQPETSRLVLHNILVQKIHIFFKCMKILVGPSL